MLIALAIIAAVFLTFAVCACILAGRADDADEALIHDSQFGDAPPPRSGASPAAASVPGSGTYNEVQ